MVVKCACIGNNICEFCSGRLKLFHIVDLFMAFFVLKIHKIGG